jgi:hypothetical protein
MFRDTSDTSADKTGGLAGRSRGGRHGPDHDGRSDDGAQFVSPTSLTSGECTNDSCIGGASGERELSNSSVMQAGDFQWGKRAMKRAHQRI